VIKPRNTYILESEPAEAFTKSISDGVSLGFPF